MKTHHCQFCFMPHFSETELIGHEKACPYNPERRLCWSCRNRVIRTSAEHGRLAGAGRRMVSIMCGEAVCECAKSHAWRECTEWEQR